jgi:uncharacterized protein (DUF952 family)
MNRTKMFHVKHFCPMGPNTLQGCGIFTLDGRKFAANFGILKHGVTVAIWRAGIGRSDSPMEMIYKIAPASFWRATEELGSFSGTQTDLADGFLHFSTEEQVRETAEKYFRGQVGLLLIAVDKDRLGKALRFEPSRGGAFFHIFMRPCRAIQSSLQNTYRFCHTGGMVSHVSWPHEQAAG